MARHLTSSTLIESVKNRAMVPENQITFKESNFLSFANEEMDMAVIPYVLSYHEDYFLVSEKVPVVRDQISYPIPYRAVGNKLRDLQFIDSQGYPSEMTRIGKGDAPHYRGDSNAYSSRLKPFYVESNMVTLLTAEQTGFLEFSYYIRPNQLVSEDRVLVIQSIAVGANTTTLTFSSIPSIFSSSTLVDIIQVKSPHKCLATDVVVAVSGNGITIDNTLVPAGLTVGDHVALAEECMIPQIPTDLHSMLAQRIACRILESMGAQAELAAANAKLAEMEQKGATVIDSRVEDAPMKVINRHGTLRTARRYVRN